MKILYNLNFFNKKLFRGYFDSGKILLASGSPRRADVFNAMKIPYAQTNPEFNENIITGQFPHYSTHGLTKKKFFVFNAIHRILAAKWINRSIETLVLHKYFSVKDKWPGYLVFCFDTVVISMGYLFGKPKDSEDAVKMLSFLSGKEQTVSTACLASDGAHCFIRRYDTFVRFRNLSMSEIREYVRDADVLDAAGSYKIQDTALSFVSTLRGSYHNIVGLPIEFISVCRGEI